MNPSVTRSCFWGRSELQKQMETVKLQKPKEGKRDSIAICNHNDVGGVQLDDMVSGDMESESQT